MSAKVLGRVAMCSLLAIEPAAAQAYHPDPAPGEQGSANIKVVAHLPLNVAGPFNTSDIEIEQERSRPDLYVDHANEEGGASPRSGDHIIRLKDLLKPRRVDALQDVDEELHRGTGPA